MTGFYSQEEINAFDTWRAKTKLCERYLKEVYEDFKKPWVSDALSEAEKYKMFVKHYANYKKGKNSIAQRIRTEVFTSTGITEMPIYDKLIVSKYVWQVQPLL